MGYDPSTSRCKECGETGHPWWDHGPVEQFGEEPIEPYMDFNLADHDDAVTITTRAQRRKIMDKHNLEPAKPRSHHGKKLFFDMK